MEFRSTLCASLDGRGVWGRMSTCICIAKSFCCSPETITIVNRLFQFSHSLLSASLWPHGLQHAGLPCPSLSPRACSNSCSLSLWCHPTISSSVTPFSSCPQSFPASGSFPVSWLFASKYRSFSVSFYFMNELAVFNHRRENIYVIRMAHKWSCWNPTEEGVIPPF